MRSKKATVLKNIHNVKVTMTYSCRFDGSLKSGKIPGGGFSAGPLSSFWSCAGDRPAGNAIFWNAASLRFGDRALSYGKTEMYKGI